MIGVIQLAAALHELRYGGLQLKIFAIPAYCHAPDTPIYSRGIFKLWFLFLVIKAIIDHMGVKVQLIGARIASSIIRLLDCRDDGPLGCLANYRDLPDVSVGTWPAI